MNPGGQGNRRLSLLLNPHTICRYGVLILIQWLFLCAFVLRRLQYLAPTVEDVAVEDVAVEDVAHEERSEVQPPQVVQNGLRVLYIITSMAEFDNGQRNTIQGKDRYQQTLIPNVLEAVHSMLASGYQVDVYLVTHYELSLPRQNLLRNALPETVGLQVWDDATPLGYVQPGDNKQDGQELITPITRALARQHRYIIKDKLLSYNFFVTFEDDMLIKGAHVDHFVAMTKELRRLSKQAPIRIQPTATNEKLIDRYYGELTKIQLARLVPGFIRVEAIWNRRAFRKGRMEEPMDLPQTPPSGGSVDLATCCRKQSDFWNETSFSEARLRDIYLWETQAIALGLHKMPANSTLDWVFLQRGIEQDWLPREKVIGEYWTGRNIPKVERPNPTLPQTINNQGGWMGTREQVFAWHRGHCKGLFLPPYEERDGLKHNVEFWSGGLNLVGMNACQLQRIVSMEDFGKHLVYHTSNNKQKSKNLVFTNVQDFWEQLHFTQLQAEIEIRNIDHGS